MQNTDTYISNWKKFYPPDKIEYHKNGLVCGGFYHRYSELVWTTGSKEPEEKSKEPINNSDTT